MALACFGSLPWTLSDGADSTARYKQGTLDAFLLPPAWAPARPEEQARADAVAELQASRGHPRPLNIFGTDKLGRDLFTRCLVGGAVSLGVGLAASLISVMIGLAWGAAAGYLGGRIDAFMMRTVDVLYGLPYILLVVLLAVAGEALIDSALSRRGARETWILDRAADTAIERHLATDPDSLRELLRGDDTLRLDLETRAETIPDLAPRELSDAQRSAFQLGVLLLAIGGVSWLTMSRVIRGQVLSLKSRPFIEAARASGLPAWRIFWRHLLPNLVAPVIVYATLTVPQAILQESFLSFLGIGVKPPLPSWGNLAADALGELNPVRVRWWLLVFPCGLLAITLLALNFFGEGLRERFDPRARRG